jgi:four helix bundle protein
MKGENLKDRTKAFALTILGLVPLLPKDYSTQVLSRQLVRSATSSGANYRAACRSKSRKDFINKLKIVEEEMDETNYWLELLEGNKSCSSDKIQPLIMENSELLSIIVKSIQTARDNARNDKGFELRIQK